MEKTPPLHLSGRFVNLPLISLQVNSKVGWNSGTVLAAEFELEYTLEARLIMTMTTRKAIRFNQLAYSISSQWIETWTFSLNTSMCHPLVIKSAFAYSYYYNYQGVFLRPSFSNNFKNECCLAFCRPGPRSGSPYISFSFVLSFFKYFFDSSCMCNRLQFMSTNKDWLH